MLFVFFRDSLDLLCLSWGVTAMNLLFTLLNSIESRYCQHFIKPSTTSRDFPSFQNTYRYHFLHRRLSSLLQSSWRRGFCEKTPEFFSRCPRRRVRSKETDYEKKQRRFVASLPLISCMWPLFTHTQCIIHMTLPCLICWLHVSVYSSPLSLWLSFCQEFEAYRSFHAKEGNGRPVYATLSFLFVYI